jgi:ABC-type thiamine transport system substrate-binding protein
MGKKERRDTTLIIPPPPSTISRTDILRSLIVQDPSQSETGAAFLLATIATFGDSKAGIVGEVAGTNWQDWWTSVLLYLFVFLLP